MRPNRWLVVLLFALAACSSKNGSGTQKPQCSDGKDNDGDGMIDFPDDLGCTSPTDNSEDSAPAPQCMDGRDNDGDGKIDYPNDPGCVAPQQDDETDDCPTGPSCPQCADGKDNDGNGLIDYPQDPGCQSAADPDEFTVDGAACGPDVHIKQLPVNNEAMGTFTANSGSALMGSCGGAGIEDVYLLRLQEPKVVVASTDNAGTAVDTVLYIRSSMCTDTAMEVACNDDVQMGDTKSQITAALQPGTYYLVVDAKDTSTSGAYDLTVQYFAGPGSPCQGPTDCGPGLECKTPPGGSQMVCSLQDCRDGVDNDGDGKIDFPNDPGCTDPMDDDETDTCAMGPGPGCPECGDGIDNDGDGLTDYPSDPSCKSASGSSEACMTSEGVTALTMPTTMGDNTGAVDDYMTSCAFGSGGADLTYQLAVPKLTSLSISVAATNFQFLDYALLDSTCGGTELECESFNPIAQGALSAGNYYLVVDGDDATQSGPFTITVSGTIAIGESCESPLAQSGALTCAEGSACKGTMGSRTCQAYQCSDGMDNDGDGKMDYPQDPGCDSPDDNTETAPGTAPKCANGVDDDNDGKTDYANDLSCWAASGTAEAFCNTEKDRAQLIYAPTQSGTTAAAHDDYTPTCQSSSSLDLAHALVLPVPVDTLTIDTLGSSFDTVLAVTPLSCASASELACDDDDAGSGTLQSSVTLTSVAAGTYAVIVDGFSGESGAYTLHTHGIVASGTACGSQLFTTGVLACPTGTTCTGTPLKCQ